ncbi:hypothetical protein E2C01_062574 [Portunus trituberculatus]|uniref:Uncharacterized protein n=1 Tax=Portunus trituberculatus TaxID=210409 RepID=A0A5B7HIE6_PORTR|nr:hypothetical protein [Portunus trituberculatus]
MFANIRIKRYRSCCHSTRNSARAAVSWFKRAVLSCSGGVKSVHINTCEYLNTPLQY